MPMTLIQGNFSILKAAPDGDSIRFYPNNPQMWRKLPKKPRTNHKGGAQLRLDSIDTLETHYQPRTGSIKGMQHQPLKYAHAGADELLKFLGFKNFTRGADEVITKSEPEQVPGFILSRFADTYGRPVAFAFKGKPPQEDGSSVQFDKSLLEQSANYHILAQGLAYPTFYSKLYPDIRQELATVAKKARKDNKGLWAEDKTNQGFVVEDVKTITEDVVILPKLFRRLLDYLAINDGSESLDGFPEFLKAKDDKLIIIPQTHITGFDYVVKVDGQKIQLTSFPEDLVFMEK
ncbi:thermonuclease family protein [Iningainema tapete]|uniref:Thermonuclease family protein n=1 Tax=Iningainema tapete BLCC-T55 TaxID=2748662 RepID=A0A8J7CFM0_9CYAN|nr:thermonuclease family protein [Iningainema tapete]MBD2775110.1 thermonuclease family protein [Iningainema tapete BLCC-T55]